MSQFDLTGFWKFCDRLKVETKDRGQVKLGTRLLGTQRRLINEMVKGLEDGVHEFVTLKARQLGISTISLAMDLYWAGKYKGINGALIVHDEPSRDQFRTTLEMYYESLPRELKWPIIQHNRNQLVFKNKSRFQYKVAGTTAKGKGTLGRSSALSFCHATECAFYGDPSGIDSLIATFAQENPHRLFHWESTANGFNHFYDMWMSSKDAVSKRAIFIGFWANELYRAKRGGDVWKAYWGGAGRMTSDERAMLKECKALYQVEMDDEQIAWRRWMLKEKLDGNEIMLDQEYPATEFAAFVASGSQFFTARKLGETYKGLHKQSPPHYFKVHVGANFADTQLLDCPSRVATLKVWFEPAAGGVYVLGADPAYGSSEEADRYAISVWRCYSDRIEQVAEFCTTDMDTYAFAWVMVYLAGAYEPCTWNLEVNGPGQAVLNELQNISRTRFVGPVSERPGMQNVMKSIRTYLYARRDGLYNQPTAIHTQTSYLTKERYLGAFKDYFERGFAVVHSRDLIDEMKSMVREEGGQPRANSRSKDDRVIAAGLAIIAWNDQVRTRLMMEGMSYERSHSDVAMRGGDQTSRIITTMFQRAGLIQPIKQTIPGVSGGIAKAR
jgi:hypothetical protein